MSNPYLDAAAIKKALGIKSGEYGELVFDCVGDPFTMLLCFAPSLHIPINNNVRLVDDDFVRFYEAIIAETSTELSLSLAWFHKKGESKEEQQRTDELISWAWDILNIYPSSDGITIWIDSGIWWHHGHYQLTRKGKAQLIAVCELILGHHNIDYLAKKSPMPDPALFGLDLSFDPFSEEQETNHEQ